MYIPRIYKAIAVVGPTATGKTRRAVSLAESFDGEIISADSRQVYRGMTIGTGKDLGEYGNVPYHLIDIAEPGEKYNLHRYLNDFSQSMSGIKTRGKLPIICGGTGLYAEHAIRGVELPDVPENPELRAALEGKSLTQLAAILATFKNLHNTTDLDTAKRAIRAIEIQQYYQDHPEEALRTKPIEDRSDEFLVIGIEIPRDERRRRITERLHSRLSEGMVDEVKSLLDSGLSAEDLIYYGLEYRYLTLYVIGKMTYDAMVHDLEIAIHQFAKRQMTWLRGMERRGIEINWLPYDLEAGEFISHVSELLGPRN